MTVNGNSGANPNYPSTLHPNLYKPVDLYQQHETWVGKTLFALQPVTDDDYVQADGLWQVLGRTPGQQDNFVYNLSSHLFAARQDVRERTYAMFAKVNEGLGRRIRESTEAAVTAQKPVDEIVTRLAAQLQ
jgi:catalase